MHTNPQYSAYFGHASLFSQRLNRDIHRLVSRITLLSPHFTKTVSIPHRVDGHSTAHDLAALWSRISTRQGWRTPAEFMASRYTVFISQNMDDVRLLFQGKIIAIFSRATLVGLHLFVCARRP